jgi:hypothetical protein
MTSENARRVVEITKEYYDGAANEINRDIWGENIHMGVFESPDDDLSTAMNRCNARISERAGTSEADRERIYDRVKSPDMWDRPDYIAALEQAGFAMEIQEDWSRNVAPSYAWVRSELERRRAEFEGRIGKEAVDNTSVALKFWVDAANAGKIGWEYFVARA